MYARRFVAGLSIAALSFGVVACGDDKESTSTAAPAAEAPAADSAAPASDLKDIVDTAVGAGSFNTLAKLLTDAGLVETLKGPGPFTVFAPTDEAFAAVPKETMDALAADKALLTKVLTYHVVPGKVLAADVKTGEADTVAGVKLALTAEGGKVMAGAEGANVVTADVMASNGVIHVIDKVMVPA
jgi:uncharacterized surface protein with fasciclin (FAS1) repeats